MSISGEIPGRVNISINPDYHELTQRQKNKYRFDRLQRQKLAARIEQQEEETLQVLEAKEKKERTHVERRELPL